MHGFLDGNSDTGFDRVSNGLIEGIAQAIEHVVEAVNLFAEAGTPFAVGAGSIHRNSHGSIP